MLAPSCSEHPFDRCLTVDLDISIGETVLISFGQAPRREVRPHDLDDYNPPSP